MPLSGVRVTMYTFYWKRYRHFLVLPGGGTLVSYGMSIY